MKKKHASKKKVKRNVKSNKNVLCNKSTATPLLPTTRCYIKPWGYYNNKNKNIIIEQINPNIFIYNSEGKLGLSKVEDIEEFDGKKIKFLGRGFIIDDTLYFVPKEINTYVAPKFYNTPDVETCRAFVKGKYNPRPYSEIHEDIKKMLKDMFDFSNDIDIETASIAIAESWVKPLLFAFFFFGIDATKGGGKTTLGEIVYFLMRHGFVGGDISRAAIPRLVDELDLNIFIDEIDQSKDDENIMGLLRKGQRRDNPYIRCEGRDNEPATYEIAGCHGFSFRGEVEDAFMDRSLRVHTSKSYNAKLPIINLYKKQILKPLADELFLWYIRNIHEVGCSRERTCSSDSKPQGRNSLFLAITEGFSDAELDFLNSIFGRDNELSFLILLTTKILGLNFLESLKNIIQQKKEDAASSESYYPEALLELLHTHEEVFEKVLKEGEYAGCSFYPKSRLFAKFNQQLKSYNVTTISSKRFTSMLRDLGFTEGDTIRSQRYEKYPSPCLIFGPKILEKISMLKKEENENQN